VRRRRLLQSLGWGGLATAAPGGFAIDEFASQGLVFRVSALGQAWDNAQVSCPRVLRLGTRDWRMYYYGRDREFDPMIPLPSGRIGLAVSRDGLRWRRVRGLEEQGSLLAPRYDSEFFDSTHVGVGDVQRLADGSYEMWYFGGDRNLVSSQGAERRGFPLRIGRALSADGRIWVRDVGNPELRGALLGPGVAGEIDELMVGWPQVLRLDNGRSRLYYHTLSSTQGFTICAAESDDGLRWQKLGALFGKGPAGAFDELGAATRHVLRNGSEWLMFYEGFAPYRTDGGGSGRAVAIGLARSTDGLRWERVPGPLVGGAIFRPVDAAAWDNRAVGTPWVLRLSAEHWRMYYVGANHVPQAQSEIESTHQIGVAECRGSDLTRWSRGVS
jgi:hypothetical protein